MLLGDFAGQHRARRAIDIADFAFEQNRLAGGNRGRGGRNQIVIERGFKAVVLPFAVPGGDAGFRRHFIKELRQIDALGFPVFDRAAHVELVDTADHFVDRAHAELRHDLAQFFGDEEEIIDDMFGLAGETRAQHRVLRRHADRACVQMAFAHHDAARGDQRRGGEAEFVRAQQRADGDVAARAQAAIDLHGDAPAQAVQHQGLLRFGQTDFPRAARMGERRQRRGARAAFETGDRHMIGARFGDARRHRAHAHFGDELHRYAGVRIGAFQVVDQLRQIFDGIDVVMRRRRDQADARRGMAHACDVLVHFIARQLSAFAGFGALRHLDLDVVGIDEIFRGHAETARRHLLDGGAHGIAIGQRLETIRLPRRPRPCWNGRRCGSWQWQAWCAPRG